MRAFWSPLGRMRRIITLVAIQAGLSVAFLIPSLMSELFDYADSAGFMFCVISTLRWTAIAYICVLAVDQVALAACCRLSILKE